MAAEAPVRPPLRLLSLATGAIALSALLLFGRGRAIDFAGYLLATVVAVFLVSTYRALDSRRRSRPTYVLPAIVRIAPPAVICAVLLVAGVAIGGMHVWRFAEAVARA